MFLGGLILVAIFWGISHLGKVFLDVSSVVKPDEGKIIQYSDDIQTKHSI